MPSRPKSGPTMGPPHGDDPHLPREGGSESQTEPTLSNHGVSAKKSFGQHFLVSGRVVSQIVSACDGLKGLLEVGPGPGALTRPLSEQAQVVALELDPRMAPVLSESSPKARVVFGDALDTDLAGLLSDLPEPRGIVSNMPYNITGPLLERFTAVRALVSRLVLMMQREVAEKVMAQPGDSSRGALSVRIQACFEVRRVCLVPPGAFKPPPKVESAVLRLTPRSDPMPERFDAVVGAGFSQPRKTLANNLPAPRDQAVEALRGLGLGDTVRAHQLTEEQWIGLATQL
ncbi:MAG: ribosomal RNA small subunit methyltransferase A [Fimbriimonadaceae bacterium]|nr:ribosomal RNA small subunit methyltransferase A [Fimbriimonadaceae bacterium]QYK58419.1 MAG: ribosomal RNA small subunit methyltransferase A [Fimbriimonadaceae bacterium]